MVFQWIGSCLFLCIFPLLPFHLGDYGCIELWEVRSGECQLFYAFQGLQVRGEQSMVHV